MNKKEAGMQTSLAFLCPRESVDAILGTRLCVVFNVILCVISCPTIQDVRGSNDMPTLPRIATPVTVLTLVLLMVVFTYLWEFHLL